MSPYRSADRCQPGADGLPSCSSGPLGRLTWTLRELAGWFGFSRRGGRRGR